MGKNALKALTGEKYVRALAECSKKTDVSLIVGIVASRIFNGILKDKEKGEIALVLCRDAELNQTGLQIVLNALFTQYLNIEKNRKTEIQPVFCNLLMTLWQLYNDKVIKIIPRIISEISNHETKPMLYSLVSQALSGMPFDSNTDLPIVLALSQSEPEIRKSALTQITNVGSFTESIKQLIKVENDPSVLLAALQLGLGENFYEVLVEKFKELNSFTLPPVECLQQIFKTITQDCKNPNTQHARIILMAYDQPNLRDLCQSAAANARNYPLFKGFQSENLTLFLKKNLVKNWLDCADCLIELVDIPLVSSLIPSTLEKVSLEKGFLDKAVDVAIGVNNFLIGKESEDYQAFESIIRAMPKLEEMDDENRVKFEENLKNLLVYLIPRTPMLCKEILAKNFSEQVLQVLCGLSIKSPEALHLAACVAFHSGNTEAVLYTVAYLILNMNREPEFRTSAIVTLEQLLHKSLPAIQVQFSITVKTSLSIFTDKYYEIKKLLQRLVKFKSGIIQDQNYIKYALSKNFKESFSSFLAHIYSVFTYNHETYFHIISAIQADSLTNNLLSSYELFTDFEVSSMLSRLSFYTNWADFPHFDYLLTCLKDKNHLNGALKVITPERFTHLKSYQGAIFNVLLNHLPESSLIIHESTDLYEFSPEVIIQAFDSDLGTNKYEALLQIVQSYPQNIEVFNKLYEELKKFNEDSMSEDKQYLKEIILVTIRIQGFNIKASNEVLEEILKTMQDHAGMEIKKNAIMALCSFAKENQKQIVELLGQSVSCLNSLEDYNFYKGVLAKFAEFDISDIVKSLIVFCHANNLGLDEAQKIVKISGNQYLSIFLSVYVGAPIIEIYEQIIKFSAKFIIQAFNTLLVKRVKVFELIAYTFVKEEFLKQLVKNKESKGASDEFVVASGKISDMFLQIFSWLADVKQENAEGKKNDKKAKNAEVKEIRSLLEVLSSILDAKTISNSFSLMLQDCNYYRAKEAVEFLLPHIETSPTSFLSLITPLCNILESNSSKIPSLSHSKMYNLSLYLQIILSILYLLLKAYKNPSNILVIYGNCILGYTHCKKIEIQSSACLCFSAFFSEKSIEYLPFLDTFIVSIFILCAHDEQSVRNCGLTCLINVIRTTEEFVNPYICKIVCIACKLEAISLFKVIAEHIPHRGLIGNLTQVLKDIGDNEKMLENLFKLCEKIGEKVDVRDLNVFKDQISEFYISSLEIVSNMKSSSLSVLSELIGKSFSKFALSMTNSQLKPITLDFFQWSIEKTDDESYNYPRLLLFCTIISQLTQQLKHLFIPYFTHFIEILIDLVSTFSNNFSSKKRKRAKGKTQRLVNSAVLSCFKYLACHDKDRFLTLEKYEKIAEVLSCEFKCVFLKDYMNFCDKELVPAIVELLKSTVDLSVWQAFTNKILFQSRSAYPEVRSRALYCVSRALGSIGKEYAGLIGDIMPFVLEGMEDVEDTVTVVAKNLLSQLETYCGDEIKDYIN